MARGPLSPASSGDRPPSNCNDNRATCRSRRHSILREKPHTFFVVSILLRLRRFLESYEYADHPGSPVRSPSMRCSGRTFPEGPALSSWVPCSARPAVALYHLDLTRRSRARPDTDASLAQCKGSVAE